MSKKKKKFKKFKVKAKINQQLQELQRESKIQTSPIATKTHEKIEPKAIQKKETTPVASSSNVTRYTFVDLKKLAIVNAVVFGLLATVSIISLKTNLILKTSELILKLLHIQ